MAKTTAVPDPSSIGLESNDAREIDRGVVLYADVSGSTAMVQSKTSVYGGWYWDRTSGPCRVKAVLYR